MRRSAINRALAVARELFHRCQVHLPPWADWTHDDWATAGADHDPIRACHLGWDVTDFGSGDFVTIGRTLFTLRNGRHHNPHHPLTYAEKLLVNPEGQGAPAHHHVSKREDIVCRQGGNILVILRGTDPTGQPTDDPVTTVKDGVTITVEAGGTVRLMPGESVTIHPGTLHRFFGEPGTGIVIDGMGHTLGAEVSSVCDDTADNVFPPGFVRFPPIDEDEAPLHLLCHEYPAVRP